MMNKITFCAIVTFCAYQILGLPVISDDAEQRAGKFEGDIVLSSEQRMALAGLRNGLSADRYRWPNNTVFYRIISDNFTTEHVGHIHRALDTIGNVSCISFIEADENATAFVRVVGDDVGCFSAVGYQGSVQDLNLAPNGCFRLGTIIHEFLHALGFFHMQSATERDEYVTIVWDNIRRGVERNFQKYNSSFVTGFNVEYDYGSVLHYSATAFSVNGNRTIVPRNENVTIGQRTGMSDGDVTKLNRMYSCDDAASDNVEARG
ncbi:zinc metalloproteinase nas-4-like [Ochlerotatus camptorhynchus]|uniref:zinc metalloproteinase nas-4-like n=1 Tax=Ochlerotatus camptorhynchus TaxID=644619 RepID=UPI0031DC9DF2